MPQKSPDAFRTISEVADWLGVQPHVLRFWESKFSQVKPVKRAGGRRYFRPADMLLLGGIQQLLHVDGMTIKGVQKILREKGAQHVSAMSKPFDAEYETPSMAILEEAFQPEEPEASAPAQQDLFAAMAEPEPEPEPTQPEQPEFQDAAVEEELQVEAPRVAVLDLPDPDEESFDVAPSILTDLGRPLDANSAELTPLIAQLAALRDRVAASRA